MSVTVGPIITQLNYPASGPEGGPEGAAEIQPTGAHVKRCSPFQQWPETLLEDSPESLKDFQLKEKLYLDAIDYLDKGKVSDLFDFISIFLREFRDWTSSMSSLTDFCLFVFQTWEKAIELCKELTEQYESLLYDYVKLGDILVKSLTVLVYDKEIIVRTNSINQFSFVQLRLLLLFYSLQAKILQYIRPRKKTSKFFE